MRKLILKSPKYGEKVAFVDDDDYELVSKYHWNVGYVRGNWYVTGHLYQGIGTWRQIKLHRLVMGVIDTPKIHIDHIDQDGLNNQKSNLRKAQIFQNSINVGLTSRNKSGFKGVYLFKPPNKLAGKYGVYLSCQKKKIFGGYFDNAVDAAIRYNELAKEHHGEFAYLNPIPNAVGCN
jgi:hypothetical protein